MGLLKSYPMQIRMSCTWTWMPIWKTWAQDLQQQLLPEARFLLEAWCTFTAATFVGQMMKTTTKTAMMTRTTRKMTTKLLPRESKCPALEMDGPSPRTPTLGKRTSLIAKEGRLHGTERKQALLFRGSIQFTLRTGQTACAASDPVSDLKLAEM